MTVPLTPTESGLKEVNDIKMYYAIYGVAAEGAKPLVMIHGGLGNADYWAQQIPVFSKTRQVIVLDSRGHGRSSMSEQTINYALMTRDVLTLMDALGVATFDLLGWSDGGIIGLELAINYPARVGKIVACGTNYKLAGLRDDMDENETFNAYIERATNDYKALSPNPEGIDAFFNNIETMWGSEPNYDETQLEAISTPMLVLAGYHEEAIRLEHTIAMTNLIPTAELAILPSTGHFALWETPDVFNTVAMSFLGNE